MRMTIKDVQFLVLIVMIYAMVSAVAFWLLDDVLAWNVTAIVGVGTVLAGQLEIFRRIQTKMDRIANTARDQRDADYRQLESLQALYNVVDPILPLPPMRRWAISPDIAVLVIDEIKKNKPKTIVEASSGVSTLISGYCLKEQGEGRVVSLDHDETYQVISQESVERHGIDSFASVRHAPLVSHDIDGKEWQWYDLNALSDVQEIEMLIIDGPPKDVQSLCRYPALPLLVGKMSHDAIIILDDAARVDEREIVLRWVKEYPEFVASFVETELGTAILRRRSAM